MPQHMTNISKLSLIHIYGVLIIGGNKVENVYDIHVKNCKFDGVIKQPTKVTGKTRNVKFDNLIINGSLVLNKEDRPYQTYSEWLTHSEMQRVPQSYLLDFSKKPKWSYVMGIEMEGMLDTYLHYKGGKSTFKGADAEANNEAIINYLKEYPAKMIDCLLYTSFLYALLSLLHYLDAEGCIGENDVLLGWEGTVFKYCIKDVLSLFLGCSASHLFRFGYLETEILRFEDLLIVVGGYLEVAGE